MTETPREKAAPGLTDKPVELCPQCGAAKYVDEECPEGEENLHAPLDKVGITEADRQDARERLARDQYLEVADNLIQRAVDSDSAEVSTAYHYAADQIISVEDESTCGHHTWTGLMALLDEHWPEEVFPTRTDHPDRDPGPRIISLLRQVDRLQARIGTLKMLEIALRQGPPPPPEWKPSREIVCPVSKDEHRWHLVIGKAPADAPHDECLLCGETR